MVLVETATTTTHLDDVSILDHRPQQLAILRLVLLLLQVSSMLRSKNHTVGNSWGWCWHLPNCTACISRHIPLRTYCWSDPKTFTTINADKWKECLSGKRDIRGVCWGGPCQWCCCLQVLQPSRTVSAPSICSWDRVWRGSLRKQGEVTGWGARSTPGQNLTALMLSAISNVSRPFNPSSIFVNRTATCFLLTLCTPHAEVFLHVS